MGAFSIPLSGLAGTSDLLNVIANNLANLNTNGYKDQTLNFADIFNGMQGVSGNGDPVQIGSGVSIEGQTTNFTTGNITSTGIASNMAIQGNGFFVVQNATNNQQVFTRDGAFIVNSQGQLCTPQGQLVMGYPSVNGVVSASSALGPISVNQASNIPAVPTSSFQMSTNLDATAQVGDKFSTPITIYDSLGSSHVMTVDFTKSAANTWNYNISLPSSDTGGTGTPTSIASGSMTFDASGAMTSPTGSIPNIQIPTLADGASPITLTWNLGANGGASNITQQDATSATTATYQNGYGVGTLTGYSVLADGTVQGEFSNNQTMSLGKVAVANFANNQGLIQVGNNDFQATFASGSPVIGEAEVAGNGSIRGSSVEGSNVSLSTEFANMIVAQQGYQANAKVLTTMNQVSQATIQLIS